MSLQLALYHIVDMNEKAQVCAEFAKNKHLETNDMVVFLGTNYMVDFLGTIYIYIIFIYMVDFFGTIYMVESDLDNEL